MQVGIYASTIGKPGKFPCPGPGGRQCKSLTCLIVSYYSLCGNIGRFCSMQGILGCLTVSSEEGLIEDFNTLVWHAGLVVDEEEEQGYDDVWFDRSGLSERAYFHQMRVGNFVETRKLLFLQ